MPLYEDLKFLKKEGIPVVRLVRVKGESDLKKAKRLGYPLVLKITRGHKTDVGGVVLNITSEGELLKAYRRLKKFGELVAQKQVSGIETIIGVKKDPTFEQVIMFGLGGVFTELLRDVSFRACPISKKEALSMMKEIRASRLLFGFRGRRANIRLLQEVLVKVSKMAVKYDIKEMDINPFIVDEKKGYAVDARIVY